MKKSTKKIVSFLMAAVLAVAMLPVGALAAENPFSDVPESAWYAKAVEYAYQHGLFNGTSSTTFSPDAPMTRAMFVQVLANKTDNYKKSDWEGKTSFSDVKTSAWYSAPVEWAAKAGLVNGVGGGKFAPEQNVTREQMAVIMYNYAKKTGNDTSMESSALTSFKDANKVSSWAKEAMTWAVSHKVINGSGGNLNPSSNAKRCEVAQVAVNADPVLENTTVDVEPEPEDDPEPEPTEEPEPAPSTEPTPTPSPAADAYDVTKSGYYHQSFESQVIDEDFFRKACEYVVAKSQTPPGQYTEGGRTYTRFGTDITDADGVPTTFEIQLMHCINCYRLDKGIATLPASLGDSNVFTFAPMNQKIAQICVKEAAENFDNYLATGLPYVKNTCWVEQGKHWDYPQDGFIMSRPNKARKLLEISKQYSYTEGDAASYKKYVKDVLTAFDAYAETDDDMNSHNLVSFRQVHQEYIPTVGLGTQVGFALRVPKGSTPEEVAGYMFASAEDSAILRYTGTHSCGLAWDAETGTVFFYKN